jgi:DNA ligase (NAD+)
MVSKQGFNIKGLSDSTIARLMSLNLVKTFEDIFTLRWEDIEKTYLGKHNRIKDLLKVIDDCKQIPLSNFIYSLGIPDMGLSKSKELAKKYVTLDNWLESEDKPNESTVDRINRLLNVGVVVLNEHR